MIKILFLVVCFQLLISEKVYSDDKSRNLIKQFDLRYYFPQRFGLEDFYVKVEMPTLKKNLLKKIPLSKLDTLYYDVFWNHKRGFYIEVVGLPKGYKELKKELKSLLNHRLDYIVPRELMPKVSGYSLKYKKTKTGSIVNGLDKTHQMDTNEIVIGFDNSGRLRSFQTRSPGQTQTSTMVLSSKDWSKNKWVIDKLEVQTTIGLQITKIISNFNYQNNSDFGLPKRIDIQTTQEVLISNNEAEKKRVTHSKIIFSNYKINKGIANKKFLSLAKVKK